MCVIKVADVCEWSQLELPLPLPLSSLLLTDVVIFKWCQGSTPEVGVGVRMNMQTWGLSANGEPSSVGPRLSDLQNTPPTTITTCSHAARPRGAA